MNDSLKDWIIQVRYPYTAGIIAVIWAGSAAFVFVRPEVSVEIGRAHV